MMGHDPDLLCQLAAEERDALAGLAAGMWLSCLIIASPFGYAAWLATQHLLLTVTLTAAGLTVLVTVVRLAVAGGGTAPNPAPQRTVTLLLLAAALSAAQPAQLYWQRHELASHVQAKRAELLAGGSRAGMADCQFLSLRLQRLWTDPGRALRATLLYAGGALLPLLLASLTATSGLRSYERLRAKRAHDLVARDTERTQAAVRELLNAFPSYRPARDDPASRFLSKSTAGP